MSRLLKYGWLRLGRTMAAVGAWLVLVGVMQYPQPLVAQDSTELELLYRRLDEQECRIRQLEALRRLPPPTPQSGPAHAAGTEILGNSATEQGRAKILANSATTYAGYRQEEQGDEKSLAQRVEELSKDLDSLLDKQLVETNTSNSTMRIAGRVHADYWAYPETSQGINAFETGDPDVSVQDSFQFRRMRFGVRGTVRDNMVYRIEMEFAGGDDSQFRDAFLGFTDLPFLQTVLIGNQKRPYSLDHLNSSRYNVFIERPFVIEGFNQDNRRLGIQSYGVSDDLQYNWRYGVFNQRLIQDEGAYFSDHYQAEFAGRFANTWWYDEASDGRGYGHWAIAGTAAHPDGTAGDDPDPIGSGRDQNEARFRTRPEARSAARWLDTGRIDGADWYELLGLEAVMNFGPLQWVAEYQNVWLQRDPGFGRDLHFDGGYMYVSYFLTGEHMPWDREMGMLDRIKPFENFFLVNTCRDGVRGGWGAWQVAVRWSYANFTDDNIAGGIGESVTFGLNWYWNPNAHIQFNYIYGDIKSHEPAAGLTFGSYHIFGTRFLIDF